MSLVYTLDNPMIFSVKNITENQIKFVLNLKKQPQRNAGIFPILLLEKLTKKFR